MPAAEAVFSSPEGRPSAFDSQRFDRTSGACSLALAAGGVAYSIAFVLSLRTEVRAAEYAAALLLAVSGLVSSLVWIAVYERVREVSIPLALWGLALGLVSATGAMIHGGYDLANLFNPPGRIPSLPNAIDPRGMLTLGVAAAAVAITSWLITLGPSQLPRKLGRLGLVAAALLFIVYLGRLILLDPENPFLLGSAALLGVVVLPWWYVWLGLTLRRSAAER